MLSQWIHLYVESVDTPACCVSGYTCMLSQWIHLYVESVDTPVC